MPSMNSSAERATTKTESRVFERMPPVAEIGVGFIKHAKRVGGFHKARHDERGGKAKAADRDNPEGYDIFNFLVQYPV